MSRNFLTGLLAAIIVFAFAVPVFSGALPKPTSANAEAQKLIDEAWAQELIDSNAEI